MIFTFSAFGTTDLDASRRHSGSGKEMTRCAPNITRQFCGCKTR
ncbi:hypothetical protein V6Z12_A01G141400 [Gossypium hirsutum]